MAKLISDAEFSSAAGVADWRVLFGGAKTLYQTGDFATGALLVAAIAEIEQALGHSPLVDVRISPRPGSMRSSRPAVGSSEIATRPRGCRSSTPRATSSTSRPGKGAAEP
jgi:4a-hydroxytetrahydrobiopterin dehydratase